MNFKVGEKVSYPNHGVCLVECVESKKVNDDLMEFYLLRVLANSSVIFVPKANADSVGIRPVITDAECDVLIKSLGEDFTEFSPDWKARIRDFSAQIQSGDLFETADVLKKLTFLARSKQLSFREQRLLEKSKSLIVSELAVVRRCEECEIEKSVDELLCAACEKHCLACVPIVSAATH